MSKFLDAAYDVLRRADSPLNAREITARAMERGDIPSSGATPSQTMKSKLSTDIVRKRDQSPFMRTTVGKFALRAWKSRGEKEYVAERQTKSLLRENVLVLPALSLPSYAPCPGLWPISPERGLDLLAECTPMERWRAEGDVEVIQLVSGFVVQLDDRVLTYRRTKRLPESRLHGEYSALFGGHLNPEDIPLWNIFESGYASFLDRELNEELRLPPNTYDIRLRGMLYDDARPVSRQHLAIVFDVALRDPNYTVGERGFLQQDKFETWREVGDRLGDFENWSRLLYGIYSSEGKAHSQF